MRINKRGDKVLSVYWFAILILVAGAIFAMVYVFYHHPYDIRKVEANVMINKVANCLSEEGRLNSNLIDEGKFNEGFKDNFLEECSMTFDVEDKWEDEVQYYLEINFYNSSKGGGNVFNIAEGNKNLVLSCEIQDEKEYKREAKCIEESFFSLDGDNLYLIKILSVVRKAEKNVR